jgi:serine protease Do
VIRTHLALGCALLALPLTAQEAPPSSAPTVSPEIKAQIDFAKSRVYPALVNISCVTRSFAGGRAVRNPSVGSGTIVDEQGHVITNYHVIQGSVRTTCTLPNGETLPATILAEDPAIDFAVLQLDLSKRRDKSQPLPHATFGDSDDVQVGDYVLAVGNPMALSSSMTLGIVSNTRRVFTNFIGTEAEALDIGAQRTGKFTLWIQTDALILPGNSGGALVSMQGEIIGMNTRGGNGLGFATPSKLLEKALAQVLAYGEVRRGWLGLGIQPDATDGDRGVLVGNVAPDSPADRAGIRAGDRIRSIAGHAVECRFIDQVPGFYGRVADLEPDSKVMVTFARDGEEHTVEATVGLHEEFADSEREYRRLGVTVRNVTRPMATAFGFPEARGVIVTGTRAGKPFEVGKVSPGDVILQLDGKDIATIDDLNEAFDEPEWDTKLALTVRRGKDDVVCVVEVEKPSDDPSGGELPRPWLGVRTQVLLPDVAEAMGMADQKGLRVTRIFEDTPAFAAGLRIGDVITGIDDEPLECYRPQDARDLETLVEEYGIGDEVTVHVRRGDERLELQTTLEASRLIGDDPDRETDEFFELTVRTITFRDRAFSVWPDGTEGVLVADCTDGGWAAMSGLSSGDLIQAIEGEKVTTPTAAIAALEKAREAEDEDVRLFVLRGTATRFVIIRPTYR